jgi:hypothetical protein
VTGFFRKLNPLCLFFALFQVVSALMDFFSAGMQKTTQLDAIYNILTGVIHLFVSWQMLQLAILTKSGVLGFLQSLSSH